MKKMILILSVITILLSCESTDMNKPGNSNSLLGVVYDNKSNPVHGAVVTFYKEGEKEDSTVVTTDIDGKFYASELPFDRYNVDVHAPECAPTFTTVDHFDIENILIIKIASYDDLIDLFQEHINSDNLELAEKKMNQLEQIDSKDIYYNYLKSMFLIKTEKYNDAEFILLGLIERTEDSAYVNLLLADLYQYHLTDNNKAYYYLNRFLKIEYSEKEAQRAKELESVL